MANTEGINIMNNVLLLTIGGETSFTEIRYYDEDKNDSFPVTEKILNTPFASSSQILVKMPYSTIEELKAYENSDFDHELFVVPRTVNAYDGQIVRIKDILEEWMSNNLRIQNLEDKIRNKMKEKGENPSDYPFLFGDHCYFEGIKDLGNGVYTMEDYGS